MTHRLIQTGSIAEVFESGSRVMGYFTNGAGHITSHNMEAFDVLRDDVLDHAESLGWEIDYGWTGNTIEMTQG